MRKKKIIKSICFYALAANASLALAQEAATQPSLAELVKRMQEKRLQLQQEQELQSQAAIQPTAPVEPAAPSAQDVAHPKPMVAAETSFSASAADVAAGGQALKTNTVASTATDNNVVTSVAERFSVGEELFLTLQLERLILGDVYGIKSPRLARLSLSNMMEILDFPIMIDLETGSAQGWFLDEENRFELTFSVSGASDAVVTVNNKQFVLPQAEYSADQNDIYIEAEQIGKWFGLQFEFVAADLKLIMTSDNLLPVQQRLARAQRKATNISARASQAVLPLRESGYKAFSVPVVDAQLFTTQQKNYNASGYSVLGSHDFAYLTSRFFFAGNDTDALSDVSLQLSKESVAADLLGPLKATEVHFGDISPVNIGIGNTEQISRGARISNKPLGNISDNKRINFTGELQQGWDVELYQNSILVAQQRDAETGRYEFYDIDLWFGKNDFELVFYGPQGQIETRNYQYFIDNTGISQGDGYYNLSVVDVGVPLFDVSGIADALNRRGQLVTGTYQYGLTDWLSLNTGVSSFWGEDGINEQRLAVGGAAALANKFLLNSTLEFDNNSNLKTDFRARTQLYNTALSLQYRSDERTTPQDDVTQRRQLFIFDMSGSLFNTDLMRVSYQNSIRHIEDFNNIGITQFSNQIAFNTRYFALSNQLDWLKTDLTGAPETLLGAMRLQKSFGSVLGRFHVDYNLSGERDINRLGAEFFIPFLQDFQATTELSYFPQHDNYSGRFALSWQKDAFIFNTNATYTPEQDWTLGANLRYSFGYEPVTGEYFSSKAPLADSGSLAVKVFEDLNGNGVLDDGEPIVEGADVRSLQSFRRVMTNENGVSLLKGMTANLQTDIVVDRESLPDPFLVPAIDGVSVIPRRGFIDVLHFPMVRAGELEGTVYLKDADGTERTAPYAVINLVDEKNNIVATTQTEFDGYYLFLDIKPGNYRVTMDPAYIDQRELKRVAKKAINMSNKGDVIAGVDFILTPLEDAEGFVVSVGQFNSAGMLKVYYHMLRKRLASVPLQKPFYVRSKTDGKYVLGLAYFESVDSSEQQAQQDAERLCSELIAKQILCQAEYHGFKY